MEADEKQRIADSLPRHIAQGGFAWTAGVVAIATRMASFLMYMLLDVGVDV